MLEAASPTTGTADGPKKAARSQLKSLPSALSGGVALGELAWAETPVELRNLLASECLGITNSSPWIAAYNGKGLKAHLTLLLDVIEASEIARLGRAGRDDAREEVAA